MASKRKAKPEPAQDAVILAEPPAPKSERELRLERWRKWRDTPGAIEELCEFIATGGSFSHLSRWCKDHDFPVMTVSTWISDDKDRSVLYARARDMRADAIADELSETANEPVPHTPMGALDSAAVADKRLRVDTLKWSASKLAPKRYGDKLDIEAKVTHDVAGDLRQFLSGGSKLPVSTQGSTQ